MSILFLSVDERATPCLWWRAVWWKILHETPHCCVQPASRLSYPCLSLGRAIPCPWWRAVWWWTLRDVPLLRTYWSPHSSHMITSIRPSIRYTAKKISKKLKRMFFCSVESLPLIEKELCKIGLTWILIQIQLTKIMRIHVDPDPYPDPVTL